MSRRALLAVVLGALGAACTSATAPAVTSVLRQPSALAVFNGLTRDDGGATLKPYLAIANAGRNDLTIVDAGDDTAVLAPIQLRTLVVPVPERPALLAAASLGDGKADLLVAVSAGDSTLQLIRTWTVANEVVPEQSIDLAVALGLGTADVLALAALPSATNTARLAVALSDRRVAVVTYVRAGDGIEVVTPPLVSAQLDFQPIALAAPPDDPGVGGVQTAIYAATLDEIVPGVSGVAELSPDLATVRPLDARGPTRLVAAARLRERAPLSTSTSKDGDAFAGQPTVARVYAVLDESGCGLDRRIACGVVTLDPVAGGIPADESGRMPYRAPIEIPGRTLALAVAQPPAVPPASDLTQYAGDAMRVFAAGLEQATTAVGVAASDNGKAYFLDLGRFKALTVSGSTLAALGATAVVPAEVDTSTDSAITARRRLWFQDASGAFVAKNTAGADDLATAVKTIDRTPGWTRSTSYTVMYQGALAPAVTGHTAEAGLDGGSGLPWLALQAGSGTASVSDAVRLYHPAFGIRTGDLVVLKAKNIAGCTGTKPPGTPAGTAVAADAMEFEATVGGILPPAAAYPGGAVLLSAPGAGAPQEWTDCFTALQNAISAGGIASRLTATIRAAEFVATSFAIGYVGRPVHVEVSPGVYANQWAFTLAYPASGDEDGLAAACPVVDWDGALSTAPACDGACRAACEPALLARRARRVHNAYEDCAIADPALTDETRAACVERYGAVMPSYGPAVAFRFGVEEVDPGAETGPVRDMSLTAGTTGGETPLYPTFTGSPYLPSAAIAFDRSTVAADAGYHFLVSYTADLVLDTSPHVNPPQVGLLR